MALAIGDCDTMLADIWFLTRSAKQNDLNLEVSIDSPRLVRRGRNLSSFYCCMDSRFYLSSKGGSWLKISSKSTPSKKACYF